MSFSQVIYSQSALVSQFSGRVQRFNLNPHGDIVQMNVKDGQKKRIGCIFEFIFKSFPVQTLLNFCSVFFFVLALFCWFFVFHIAYSMLAFRTCIRSVSVDKCRFYSCCFFVSTFDSRSHTT